MLPSSTRGGAMPMTERMSVVFPMPLRPSSATTRPLSTRIDTPRNTCASPYAARRLAISSIVRLAEVNLLHALVRADRIRAALDEHRAVVQARDVIDEAQREIDVMLDQHERQRARQRRDRRRHGESLGRRQSRRGLVEQQQ